MNYSLPFMMMARIEAKKRRRNVLENQDACTVLKSDFISRLLT